MIRVRRRGATSAIALVAAMASALALAACGGGVKNSNATSSATTGTTGPSAGAQVTTGTGTITQPTTTSTVTAATNGEAATALAQQTVRAPNSKDGTIDMAVLGLAVQGQLATLSVRFTPHFPSAAPDDSISLYDMSDGGLDPSDISLVDPVGLKRYLVVRDANEIWLGASQGGTAAVNNSSVTAHWTFAAPPPTVTKIGVQLGPFPPLNDVPISR